MKRFWKIIDNIAGEIIEVETRKQADSVVKERLSYHGSTFVFGHRCHHYGTDCDVSVDCESHVITINVKR